MRILVAGGGSGGHVTPVVAVIAELKKQSPRARIRFWTDFKFYQPTREKILAHNRNIKINRILSGKFRRYSGFTLGTYLKNPLIILLNIRDSLLLLLGFFQCFFKLILWRPDVVFLKGGYVCLPIGLAAHILRIPFVIHDSDTVPGLTNRILSRFAHHIATGMPLDNYNYPTDKATYVGIPTSDRFVPISKQDQRELKTKLGFDPDTPLALITGGGLGARSINLAVVSCIDQLLRITNLQLISGKDNFDEVNSLLEKHRDSINSDNFRHYSFVSNNYEDVFLASDIIVARAGATNITELASAAKTAIIVPNAKLPGSHQTKNAEFLLRSHAAIVIDNDQLGADPSILADTIQNLLQNHELSRELAHSIHQLAMPDAASAVASIILKSARQVNE